MDAYLKAFWLPKDGCNEDEYEDAFFPRNASSLSGQRLRFAVADGATEASFSKLWARLLVRAFVRRAIDLPLTLGQLVPLQEQWAASIHGKTLPWYAEEKAASGAFSSLLGLEILEDSSAERGSRTWRATAVGDSCLFQFSGDRMMCSFPLNQSAQFTNSPNLLGSLPGVTPNGQGLVSEHHGTWKSGDQFWLMTDALACWFLKESEQSKKPSTILTENVAREQAAFAEFITKLRRNRAVKNDDVTLLQIELFGSKAGWD